MYMVSGPLMLMCYLGCTCTVQIGQKIGVCADKCDGGRGNLERRSLRNSSGVAGIQRYERTRILGASRGAIRFILQHQTWDHEHEMKPQLKHPDDTTSFRSHMGYNNMTNTRHSVRCLILC
jgi:hypothetical protein